MNYGKISSSMNSLEKFVYYWLPVVLWMALIYFLSSFHKLQSELPGWQDYVLRKIAHFLEYAILFNLFYRGFKNTSKLPNYKLLSLSFLLTILYAISDEFHQTFVSGRSGRIFDIGVDTLGSFAGLGFVVKFSRLLPSKVKKLFFE